MDRARRSYAALRSHFVLDEGRALYRETTSGRDTATLWPYSQLIAAAADIGARENLRTLVTDGLANYWDGTAYRPGVRGGDRYYDDNAWVGLDLVRAHRVLDDASLLDAAARVFTFVASGWDTDASHPHPGGVFWRQVRRGADRNTVSNAPNAQLALQLHDLTGRDEYLAWARRMHDWVDGALRDPHDGLYWDHVKSSGEIDTAKWTYNQGSMAGAKLGLGHLGAAEDIARTALAFFERTDYRGQSPAFNAIFFRNLLDLSKATADRALQDAIAAALTQRADALWASTRSDDLVGLRGDEPVRLIDQAAAVQMYAMADDNHLESTRAFFGPRASGWNDKFHDDNPAYRDAIADLAPPPNGVAVDLGCGTGRALPFLQEAVGTSGVALGIDATPEMLHVAAEHSPTLALGDVVHLPLRAASVDVFFAAGLLGHVPDPGAFLRSLIAYAKPDARLGIFIPIGRAALARRHERELRPDELLDPGVLPGVLEANGWVADVIDDDRERRYLAIATLG